MKVLTGNGVVIHLPGFFDELEKNIAKEIILQQNDKENYQIYCHLVWFPFETLLRSSYKILLISDWNHHRFRTRAWHRSFQLRLQRQPLSNGGHDREPTTAEVRLSGILRHQVWGLQTANTSTRIRHEHQVHVQEKGSNPE